MALFCRSITHLLKKSRPGIINLSARHRSTYTPRRACLYVPASDQKKLSKIPTLKQLDCTILDCEDGVAANRKEEARHGAVNALDTMDFGGIEPIVRVNSVTSGLAADDVAVTLSAKHLPPTLMLPKVDAPDHLDWFAEEVENCLQKRPHQYNTERAPFKLIIYMESAVGLLNLPATCQRGVQLHKEGAPFVLEGIVFGSDDFVADIGAVRTTDAKEILYARQKVVVVAKAHGLQAIDMVHINFKDQAALQASAEEGAAMGYTGKQVIHPAQVDPVQTAFTPSQDRIQWATELITAFQHHQQEGKGAFTFRGAMIDMPLLLQAQNIVDLMEAVNNKQQGT